MITELGGVSALGGLLSGFKPEGLGDSANAAGAQQAAGGQSFMDALSNIAGNAVDGLDKAQGLSVQALQGDVATREVVDAVMSAEQSLQTAIAIRDKIVTAYLEISRMAI